MNEAVISPPCFTVTCESVRPASSSDAPRSQWPLRSLPAYSDARLRQLVDECLHELEMAAMESDDLEAACTRAENVIAAFPILAARTE